MNKYEKQIELRKRKILDLYDEIEELHIKSKTVIYGNNIYKPFYFDTILNIVNNVTGVNKDDINTGLNKKEIIEARRIVILVLRDYFNMTFEGIGNIFSKRHSSMIESYKKSKSNINNNPIFRQGHEEVVRRLKIQISKTENLQNSYK